MKKFLGITLLMIIWQIASIIITKKILPAPIAVAATFFANFRIILIHSGYSIFRLVVGMLLALAVGMPLGILIGYYKKAGEIFSPLVYTLAPIPKIALLPLIMLFFGIGEAPKIFIIFIIMVFQVIMAAHDSVKSIPEQYFMPLRTIKAKNLYIIEHVIIPASLPDIFTAIRIGLATSISVLFFAETFGTHFGMGFYITDMWMRFDYKQMYAGILTLALIGLASASLVNIGERIICPWNDKK